jgi:hypothetical protein
MIKVKTLEIQVHPLFLKVMTMFQNHTKQLVWLLVLSQPLLVLQAESEKVKRRGKFDSIITMGYSWLVTLLKGLYRY